MAKVDGIALRTELPVQRGSGIWAFDQQVARGAWSDDFASDDWMLGKVVFQGDHADEIEKVLASTDNGSLSVELGEVEGSECLVFTADLLADDDPNRTAYMTTVLQQLRSGRVSQVSAGFAVDKYVWTYPDEENGLERDLMTVTRARLVEMSVVVFGAQGDSASVRIVKQALARGSLVVDECEVHLREGPMRLMEMRHGELVPFDMKAAYDAAQAKRVEKNAGEAKSESGRSDLASARDRIRSRGNGG